MLITGRLRGVMLLFVALVGGGLALTAQSSRAADAAALRTAQQGEWLTYGRDYAETHFSPLALITRENVRRLDVAWSTDFGNSGGQVEATPLFSDGVLYATGSWSVVIAVDARTGTLKWRWDPGLVREGVGAPMPCCGAVNRGVALYDGKVYAGLLDGRLVALDANTGRIVWVRQTTPVGSSYTITGAPRVVKGKVIIGNAGADYGVRGYVTAYDAGTGDQVWRFYTVPGDPSKPFESSAMERAAATWRGEWWKHGGGGTVWDSLAFDPEADLLYVGAGNGSPWSRVHRSAGTGDNLYLASILALRPDTGNLVWHYQTAPGDEWDYTATQTMILADVVMGGRLRKVLMQAPKNGFFYVLDRLTGELISAEPFVPVSWATAIDKKTGRPIETPNARYGSTAALLSPATGGAHNWQPMAWSPESRLAFIPARLNSQYFQTAPTLEVREGRYLTGLLLPPPGQPTPPPPTGVLLAWDPVAQRERWAVTTDGPMNGGVLATAAGLVFNGTQGGAFRAYDSLSGAVLWEMPVGRRPATPITYRLDGRQYVTVLAGLAAEARMWTFALRD